MDNILRYTQHYFKCFLNMLNLKKWFPYILVVAACGASVVFMYAVLLGLGLQPAVPERPYVFPKTSALAQPVPVGFSLDAGEELVDPAAIARDTDAPATTELRYAWVEATASVTPEEGPHAALTVGELVSSCPKSAQAPARHSRSVNWGEPLALALRVKWCVELPAEPQPVGRTLKGVWAVDGEALDVDSENQYMSIGGVATTRLAVRAIAVGYCLSEEEGCTASVVVELFNDDQTLTVPLRTADAGTAILRLKKVH